MRMIRKILYDLRGHGAVAAGIGGIFFGIATSNPFAIIFAVTTFLLGARYCELILGVQDEPTRD